MSVALDILSFNGHDLQTGVYTAYVTHDGGIPNTVGATAVLVERAGRTPVFVRGQLAAAQFSIEVQLFTPTRANWNTLQAYFDPLEGAGDLIARPQGGSSGDEIVLEVFPESFTVKEDNIALVGFKSGEGVWKSVTADTDSFSVPSEDIEITPGGNTRTYPVLTITAGAAKDDAVDFAKRRRILSANRSFLALDDPIGDGYPILLMEMDDYSITPGDDVRVLLNDEEQFSYISGNKLWVNLRYSPGASLENDGAWTNVSPAAEDSFFLSNDTGAAGFPNEAYILHGTEAVLIRVDGPFQCTVLKRGALGTTAAAHDDGATWWWVEHPDLQVIYDKDTPGVALRPEIRAPKFNIADSTNTLRVYDDGFFNDSDIQSGAFQVSIDEKGSNMRISGEGGHLIIENLGPTDDKPGYNVMILNFPVPIAAGAGGIVLVGTIDAALVQQIFVTDVRGQESLADFATASDGTITINAGIAITRIRIVGYNGVVAGVGTDNDPDIPVYPFPLIQGASNTRHVLVDGQNPDWNPFDPEDEDPETATYQLIVAMSSCIYLTLDEDIIVDAMNVKVQTPTNTGNLYIVIYNESRDQIVGSYGWGGITVGNKWYTMNFRDLRLIMAAGTYYAFLSNDIGGVLYARLEINPDFGIVQLPQPHHLARVLSGPSGPYAIIPDGSQRVYQNGDISDDLIFGAVKPSPSGAPLFTIIGRAADPDQTTPTQPPAATGGSIDISEATFILDSASAPLIVVGPELGLYLVDARLQNELTDQFIDIFHPMTPGQTMIIDCRPESRQVLDGETNRPILTAIQCSDEDEWIHMKPNVVNELSWSEAGADVDVTVQWYDRHLG